MRSLKRLWLKHSSITHINFKELSNLIYFSLGSSSALKNIDGIHQLKNLKWLELENIKMISNISELSKIHSLKVLAVNGSTWTTQKIDSLYPLASLEKLVRLQ